MNKHALLIICLLLFHLNCKSQDSDSSSFLTFTSYQNMVAYYDSLGKLEMTLGWEKATNNIVIDPFGNRIKLKNINDSKDKLFVLGVKGSKYKSSGNMYIIPFYQCTDDTEQRCSVRLMLQDEKNITEKPSYLYIDYFDVTYVYQLFWNSKNKQDGVHKSDVKDEATEKKAKQGCLFVGDSFSSVYEAQEEVNRTTFTFHDTFYPESKNLTKASYYACEKKDGHMSLSLLIIVAASASYIYRDVPKDVWNEFKTATSTDIYLEQKIKTKFKSALKENSGKEN